MVVRRRRRAVFPGTNVIIKKGTVAGLRKLACSCGGNLLERRDPITQQHAYKCVTCGNSAVSTRMD